MTIMAMAMMTLTYVAFSSSGSAHVRPFQRYGEPSAPAPTSPRGSNHVPAVGWLVRARA